MNPIHHTFLAAATIFLAAPLLSAQVTESAINKQLDKIGTLAVVQQPAAIIKVATDIRSLQAGKDKVGFADTVAHLATKGDQGTEALQAAADTLTQALTETPLQAKKDLPPPPYLDLARLVRYKGAKVILNDPLFAQAKQILISNDVDIQKVDFTLKDLKGKKVTLSELKGKIVMINFWATGCQGCNEEMGILDFIYSHYQSQGLVVLSITGEEAFKVASFMATRPYHPSVLIDPNNKVAAMFHVSPTIQAAGAGMVRKGRMAQADDGASVDGIPRTFVFNRDGKLVGEGIDQCTQTQFYEMLIRTDLKP